MERGATTATLTCTFRSPLPAPFPASRWPPLLRFRATRPRPPLGLLASSSYHPAGASGAIDPSLLLEQIEAYIATVKEEDFSRKDILERVEKWLNACEEEAWLEDYNKDDNRYNAGRGAHIMLKRAEKARVLVNKIPGMVDVLKTKIIAWEKERGTQFTYDGVGLLLMLEEYMIVRQEKEQEKKRQRDHKKLQDQLKAEQEALYGSKPSPSKPHSTKKVPRNSRGGAKRRLSLGGASMQPPKSEILH